MSSYVQILDFWFAEIAPAKWWKKDAEFDQEICQRFGSIHARARTCELAHWRDCADGRLAEVIVLDQFSRNMFRDTAESFDYDPLALALAQEAVSLGADKELSPIQRNFLYMPYMHSESSLVHKAAVELFSNNTESDNLNFELRHKVIIDRFGRYPHRNEVLLRQSTKQETAFLQEPGSSF
ncbi:MAG: hypothetical protein ACI9FR_000708 [Cryomorphaceae bacterium]|jgi:uncharacterized protein (DUF924 family)